MSRKRSREAGRSEKEQASEQEKRVGRKWSKSRKLVGRKFQLPDRTRKLERNKKT